MLIVFKILTGFALLIAQPSKSPASPSFQSLLEQLDSDVWIERERAMASIGASESIPMDSIEAALLGDRLSAEQRMRLERAAVNRFRFEPLGGLGVSFGQASEGAVQIGSVVEGFPAAKILEAGDLITAVGDRVIGGQDHLRAEILSRRPGESLPVLVRRGRIVLELNLPLGEYANLTGAASLDDATVAAALRLRRSRAGVPETEPDRIGTGIDTRTWLDAAFSNRFEPIAGDGERRGPVVVPSGSVRAMDRTRRRRSYWKNLASAADESMRVARESLQRQMTSGLLLRGVYLDYQRSLLTQVQRAQGNGEDVAGLELALDQLANKLADLDARLSETAQEIDREEP
ncbi:MAG: PDZ domain-containing protein [Phycisphaerales bacterium]